jgi:hypothetical protein
MHSSLLRNRQLFVIAVLLLVGPVLIAVHPSMPFLNDGHCDPWYPFGLFYYLSDAVRFEWAPLQAARLTNVLPGYLLTKVFNGIVADYLLFFVLYSASVLLLYQTLRTLINDTVAIFAAIFFAAHPLVAANYSVTYASPAVLYSIVSLYFVARAMIAPGLVARIGLLFGSGAAMGAAIHANLGIVEFGMTNYLIYSLFVLLNMKATISRKILSLLQAGCAVTFGAAVCTVVLGIIAVLLGGNFSLVFGQFLALPAAMVYDPGTWKADWYLHGGIAGQLLAAMLMAALTVYGVGVRVTELPEAMRQRILAASWAIIFLIVFQVIDNTLGDVYLQYDYYYVFFTPYLCVVIFLPLVFLRKESFWADVAWGAIFLACGFGAIALNDEVLGALHRHPVEALASVGVALTAFLIYFFVIFSDRSRPAFAVLYGLSVILMLAIVRPDQYGAQIWTDARTLDSAREYRRIREGLAKFGTVHFSAQPFFWVDATEGQGEVTAYPRAYFSCKFYGPFPAIGDLAGNGNSPFAPGDDVVVIGSAPELEETADKAFAALGLTINKVANFAVAGSVVTYRVLVEHVSGARDPVSSYRWLLDGSPSSDAEEVDDAFGPPHDAGSGSILSDTLPVDIRTPATQGGLAAYFQPHFKNLKGPIFVRVRADVHEGPVGIGILKSDGRDFLSRKFVAARGSIVVTLPVGNPALIGSLVVQSGDEDKAADVTIDAITVLQPKSTVPSANMPSPQRPAKRDEN